MINNFIPVYQLFTPLKTHKPGSVLAQVNQLSARQRGFGEGHDWPGSSVFCPI
jgi:hypothetical protein